MKKNSVLLLVLTIILYCGYFLFLGSYPLLDADETRYVDMARSMLNSHDFMTLYLNGEYFFEKPPLYFWIECLGFRIFGGVNELTARMPIVLLSILPAGLLFGLCNKIKGLKFAFISSVILLTSLEYILLTKIAILDSVLTSFTVSAVLCYFYTFFVENKNKKWFWMAAYIFMGLAVMAKGIPGFVVPAGTIAVSTIVFKKYKETFKYMPFGILLFLLITLPWHIFMLKTYPDLFFSEYIYKHHILRFLGSEVINRSQPWYFYILTLLWGLVPHTFILFAGIKNIRPNLNNDYSRFITLNIIASLVILLFFSISATKLITYILPIYPFLAVLVADIWMNYIENDSQVIRRILLIINSILVFGALGFPFVASYLLKGDTGNMHLMQVSLAIVSYYLIMSTIKNERFKSFIFQAVFFSLLVGFVTPIAYRIDYSFGQNDLMSYAKLAKENNYTISTYLTGRKYSLLYYSGLPSIHFQLEKDLEWLNKELALKNHLVIVRNSELDGLPVKVSSKGVKYSVVEKRW